MSNDSGGLSLSLGDLEKHSFVFTVSREQAIMYGHAKPTPEEVAQYNADSRRRWEDSVADWVVLDAAIAQLGAIADPLARKVLDLHACAPDEAVCDACSFDSDDAYDEQWPCPTVKVVAAHFGITLPEGYFGHRPPVKAHEMPPEGYRPFVPPLRRWHSAH